MKNTCFQIVVLLIIASSLIAVNGHHSLVQVDQREDQRDHNQREDQRELLDCTNLCREQHC